MRFSSVHPHARGEHALASVPALDYAGSSPRTWGTRTRGRPRRLDARFIPTHVGNTVTQYIYTVAPTVHPHARGEHSMTYSARWPVDGSSPRTWGTRRPRGPDCPIARFIPTHVGNTVEEQAGLRTLTVHPHARGEHVARCCVVGRRLGSSPRTWGTLIIANGSHYGTRFIPTHVGNTLQFITRKVEDQFRRGDIGQ